MKKELLKEKISPPEIHFISNFSAVIDGADGVLEYDGQLVRLSLGCINVKFCGSGLTIKTFSNDKMTVDGCIAAVEFESP